MKYRINGNRLQVTKKLAQQNSLTLKHTRIILLQHLFQDTLEFINHLVANGAIIHKVLGKQYVIDEAVLQSLKERNIAVTRVNYKDLGNNPEYLLNLLIEA